MTWSRSAALALLSLTLPPNLQTPVEEPLPHGVTAVVGPLSETWTRKKTSVTALRVRLNGLGVKTHANWVLFRLPFDARQRDRVRSVVFTPHVDAPTSVGALRIGSVCSLIPAYGDVGDWTLFTASGIGDTERFYWHPVVPTTDPTILGINVPTRVANYVACGRDERLRNPQIWMLDISWEVR
jgi:hypothetical protein